MSRPSSLHGRALMGWHSSLPPPETKFGVICTVLSIIAFKTLDNALKSVTPPEAILSKGPEQIWRWRNMVVSWVHALLVGTWDILCFYYYPTLMNDLVDHVVPFTYYMVAISTGYFLFDFWDMCVQKKTLRMWELTLHHFAVLSAFIYNIVTVKYIAYTVVALLAEVNSIFLHTRKLMQMHKVPFTTSVYRFNAVLNLLTFAGCRGFALFRITYGMYTEPYRMSPFYFALLCASMLIMNLLNPVLFCILLRNDFLRSTKPSTESKNDDDLTPKPVKLTNSSNSHVSTLVNLGFTNALVGDGFPGEARFRAMNGKLNRDSSDIVLAELDFT
ncbi:putative transmembrane protein 56 [Fasciola hepatica]|uniref:Transmembrane protein 56 n=1 Tax=Fasciola hepatica TaxID=6192 RepID=A0A2H1CD96_FASHE|nr:putative transmembrane protein 56 [Fasciola hepatica]